MAPPPKRGPKRYPQWVAFGQRLKALRDAKGWASYEVADMIGVDPATMSAWENARRASGPERANVVRLTALYKVSTDSLGLPETIHGAIRDDTPGESDSTRSDHSDARSSAGSGLSASTRLEIRAAVYDALVAFIHDLHELAITTSRERATADAAREIRSGTEDAAPERARHDRIRH